MLSASAIDDVVSRVNRASDGPGTDEEGIFLALQVLNRNIADINLASAAYKKRFGMTLEEELNDEMSGSELQYGLELIGIAKKQPLIRTLPSNSTEYRQTAGRLVSAMPHGAFGWGTEEENIYAVLLPFGRDVNRLKELKIAYRELTGRVLREDLRHELSGSELAYALYLANDEASETAVELAGMVGSRLQWRTSIFLPCKDAYANVSGQPVKDISGQLIPCTDFMQWATTGKGQPPPALVDTSVMNCWEVILLAAYNAGEISYGYINKLYTNIPACNVDVKYSQDERIKECNQQQNNEWMNRITAGELTSYHPHQPASKRPAQGDMVFFNGLEHVAMATGNGSNVYTFWPAPDIAFTRNTAGAVPDRVKVVTIEALYDWWVQTKQQPPVIQFGRPEWQTD